MRSIIGFLLLSTLAVPLFSAPALAHDAGAPAEWRADWKMWLKDARDKLDELVEATPEDKMTWRPGEGVRSQAEVFLHVAAANYGLPNFWGVPPPEGFNFQGYEQSMTKKADIRKALSGSFDHVEKAMESASAEDMNKEFELFGNKFTVRSASFLLLSHAHEHLGQSIAYARSNEITPPWTARQQAAAAERAKAQSEKPAEKKADKKKGGDY